MLRKHYTIYVFTTNMVWQELPMYEVWEKRHVHDEQGKCQRRIAQQAGDHGGRFLAAGQIRRDRWLDFVPECQGAACRSLGLQTHRNSHGEHEGAHRRQDEGDIERDAQKTRT